MEKRANTTITLKDNIIYTYINNLINSIIVTIIRESYIFIFTIITIAIETPVYTNVNDLAKPTIVTITIENYIEHISDDSLISPISI